MGVIIKHIRHSLHLIIYKLVYKQCRPDYEPPNILSCLFTNLKQRTLKRDFLCKQQHPNGEQQYANGVSFFPKNDM